MMKNYYKMSLKNRLFINILQIDGKYARNEMVL